MTEKITFTIYKARDNSGFIIYNKLSGETSFVATELELKALTAKINNEYFTETTQ